MLEWLRARKVRWLALLALLGLCAGLQFALAVTVYGMPVADQTNLISMTITLVWCPRSLTVGWTLGHGWTAVRNVIPCPPGSQPAAWIQLWWRGGKRTVLCLDPGKQRC